LKGSWRADEDIACSKSIDRDGDRCIVDRRSGGASFETLHLLGSCTSLQFSISLRTTLEYTWNTTEPCECFLQPFLPFLADLFLSKPGSLCSNALPFRTTTQRAQEQGSSSSLSRSSTEAAGMASWTSHFSPLSRFETVSPTLCKVSI